MKGKAKPVARGRNQRHIGGMARKSATLESLAADMWWVKAIGGAAIFLGLSAAVVLNNQIADIKTTLGRIDGRLERLDSIERRLDRLENKVDGIGTKIDRLPTKTGAIFPDSPNPDVFPGFQGVRVTNTQEVGKAFLNAPAAEYWIFAPRQKSEVIKALEQK